MRGRALAIVNLALAGLLCFSLPSLFRAAVADHEGPKARLERMTGRLDSEQIFAYREVSRTALAHHWEELSSSQRERFVATLRDLVSAHYEGVVSRQPAEWDVSYEIETIAGDEATVDATARGGSRQARQVYRMERIGGSWMIVDIITDDSSLEKAYRVQFDKIIRTRGFDALLVKMKQKRDEFRIAPASS